MVIDYCEDPSIHGRGETSQVNLEDFQMQEFDDKFCCSQESADFLAFGIVLFPGKIPFIFL
jgi:hypothetical protein